MSRIVMVGMSAAFLVAPAFVSPHLEMGLVFSSAAYAEANPKTTRTKKPDHFTKRGKQGGGSSGSGPAGLAVSDEGAPGSKPVKGGKK